MKQVMITAALNGAFVQRSRVEAVPLSPQEIAVEAQRAVEAGATVVHVHARESSGAVSYRLERQRETILAIRERCDVVVSLSADQAGFGFDDRAALVEARPDLVVVPLGTMTRAVLDPSGEVFEGDHAVVVRFGETVALCEKARSLGVRPWLKVYDLGHVATGQRLIERGVIEAGSPFLASLGVLGGLPDTVHNLCRMVAGLGRNWSVEGTRWPTVGAAIAMGGHVRVGFEDAPVLPSGAPADSNAALVEVAANLARGMGRPIATLEQTRSQLGLT